MGKSYIDVKETLISVCLNTRAFCGKEYKEIRNAAFDEGMDCISDQEIFQVISEADKLWNEPKNRRSAHK